MEPNQIVQQPTPLQQTPPESITPPTLTSKLPIVLLVLFSLISLSGLVYFYLQAQSLKQQMTMQSSLTPITTTQPTTNPTNNSDNQTTTYSNAIFGMSFKYPTTFSLNDNLQKSSEANAWTTKNTLILKNDQNNCEIVLMVNPDGFGPWFPNKQLNLSYVDGQGFQTTSIHPNSENLTEGTYYLVGTGTTNYNQAKGIWISASCPDSQSNQVYIDSILEQLLSTFQFIDSQ